MAANFHSNYCAIFLPANFHSNYCAIFLSSSSAVMPGAPGSSTTPQQALLSFKEQMTRAFKATGT